MVALAGGVGAARFLAGLVRVIAPDDVTIIGNTGDDATFHGLHVSPDLDIVTYTLAGEIGPLGWGFRGDTTHALQQMSSYGVDTWFTLGDRDLGTHLARTTWLQQGVTLSEVTERIRKSLGVGARIIPMSDDPVRTKVLTAGGVEREFQEYFVRFRHSEDVAGVRFEGAEAARPAPGVLDALAEAARIVICPSNPVVSIAPILAVPGIREALRRRRADVVAVSPIVQGAALKGPAGRMLPVAGAESSASGVAGLYTDICATFIVDRRDTSEAARVEALGMRCIAAETVMDTIEIATSLAREVLAA